MNRLWPHSLTMRFGLAGLLLAVSWFVYDRLAEPEFESRAIIEQRMTLWWDGVPPGVPTVNVANAAESNILPEDYIGPESCRQCHKSNYESWSHHAHRRMNQLANESTVVGDFSGDASISYLSGVATFYREGKAYRMKLERGAIERVFDISQTIGSRFFQYYVGTLLNGPEADGHRAYKIDHVLPFGYWLDRNQWVPTVHVHRVDVGPVKSDEELLPESQRPDPFAEPSDDFAFSRYAFGCSDCHTTFALADGMIRQTSRYGQYVPVNLHFSVAEYLSKHRPQLWDDQRTPSDYTGDEVQNLLAEFRELPAIGNAVTLGVSCEACHLGAKAHAEGKLQRPKFFPHSPLLRIESHTPEMDFGRSHANVNWACGRCHSGARPLYAGGMGTWNSIEYTDAMRGSCYSELTCIECHNPHKTIGKKWTLSPAQDDALCLKCHQQLESAASRRKHTHHAADSAGSRCMNCHMPRINEGMQNIVRTHTIFSPNDRAMLASNHPNACNLCHTDQPIDWTLGHLKKWYGSSVADKAIDRNYPFRDGPVGLGWLKSENESVRLVAADALTRTKSRWALPQLLRTLNDSFLLNRQFSRIGLEDMLGIRLADYGYEFYMTPSERREPLAKLQKALLSESGETPSKKTRQSPDQ